LQGVISNLLSLSNTQYEGRPIFAGTSASPQAYDASGNYLGNSDAPSVVIGPGSGAGQSVDLSVPGTTMFGVGAANVFATLSAAATALQSGAPTSANLSTALDALTTNIATAQQASAVLGDSSEEVASVTSSLTTQIANVQNDQAQIQDVNVATVTTQLDSETTNYQAALWAASQSIPETLVKFIAP
jgi:flagellar hook-associated protein 3 FlgL